MAKKVILENILPLQAIEQLPFYEAQKYLLELKAKYSTLSLIKYWGTNSKYIYGKIYKKYAIPTSGKAIKIKKQTVFQQENEMLLKEIVTVTPPVPAVEVPNKPQKQWEKAARNSAFGESYTAAPMTMEKTTTSIPVNAVKSEDKNAALLYLNGKFNGTDLKNALHLLAEILTATATYEIKVDLKKKESLKKPS